MLLVIIESIPVPIEKWAAVRRLSGIKTDDPQDEARERAPRTDPIRASMAAWRLRASSSSSSALHVESSKDQSDLKLSSGSFSSAQSTSRSRCARLEAKIHVG